MPQSCLKSLITLLAALLLIIPSPPAADATAIPAKQYRQARACLLKLSENQTGSRENWLAATGKFRTLYRKAPRDRLAPSCLFMMARAFRDMYQRFKNPLDLAESLAYYEDIIALFPEDRLADDALLATGKIYLTERRDRQKAVEIFKRVLNRYPDGDMQGKAVDELTALGEKVTQPTGKTLTATAKTRPRRSGQKTGSPAASRELKNIKYWSNSDYTRVVIETSGPVKYTRNILKETRNQPRRLFIDLENCRITPKLTKPLPIDDGLLRRVRSGQHNENTVRVVLDTVSLKDYKIFSLRNPFRIVIDVSGKKKKIHRPPADQSSGISLARQLGLGIKRIIIDPGHGGKDPGARGSGGLQEKDIVLKVGRLLKEQLRRELGCEVIMTRDSDIFIPLEERTAIANSRGGDLFLSIHVNAAPSRKVRGIETYILDLARTKSSMRIAARENAASSSQISDLQDILSDLMQNSKKDESIKLAEYVQESMVNGLEQTFHDINDLGVKQAPFFVLVGARMPAILTEISFISNPQEAGRLRNEQFLRQVAKRISAGVSRYAGELKLASRW